MDDYAALTADAQGDYPRDGFFSFIVRLSTSGTKRLRDLATKLDLEFDVRFACNSWTIFSVQPPKKR